MQQIEILYIILGLLLGFFVVYITSPRPEMIIKYPTIDNIRNTRYVDENGTCYKYLAREVLC